MNPSLTAFWRWLRKPSTPRRNEAVYVSSNCWGRDAELGTLLAKIQHDSRSATLVYGDSGIGKSTLLGELANRLHTARNVSVGFFESPLAEPDPLLRALDRLLGEIYSIRGSGDQIRIIFRQFQSLPTFQEVEAFLLQVQRVAADWAGLGALAETLLETEQKLVKQLKRLDLDVPAEFRPKLGVNVFEEIVEILQKALPSRKLVFIIDNLSPGLENATLVGSSQVSLITILDYLSRRFARAKDVHFVLSWKLTPATQKAFVALRAQMLQYGGDLLHLSPINDSGALATWLGKLFPWFSDCSPDEAQIVLSLSRGLPQVVAHWQESNVTRYDRDLLDALAQDVITRRYESLESQVGTAEESDRRLLYSLTLMQHPIDAASLGLFTNQPTIQASFERLESWVNKGLLRVWRPSSSGHAELYEFEHEAKREAGQRALRSSFSDAGAALDLQCYGLFLNFLGPPLKLTPLGPAYLFDALTLVEKVDRPRDESLLLRSLFQMAIMQPGATEMPSSSYLESGCPLNLIANLLNLLFITKTHTLELTDLLTRILLRDVERQTLTSNVVTVVGSAFGFAAEYFLTQKKSALSEEILKKLLGLFRTEPDEEHSFGEIVGSVMVKFMGHFAVTERNDQRLAELTDQFRAVYESSGRNGALAGFWALALRNLTTDATYKHDEDLTDRFLQELRNVSEHHPHSEIIALQLWSALGEASILYISKPDLFQALVKEQLQLRKKYPGLEERALKEVSRQQERFKRIVEDGEAKHGAERDDDT